MKKIFIGKLIGARVCTYIEMCASGRRSPNTMDEKMTWKFYSLIKEHTAAASASFPLSRLMG